MLLVLILIFLGIFLALALFLVAAGAGASKKTKYTLETLRSALATPKTRTHDELVDVRKEELLSAVPWINRWLLKIEAAPRMRLLLYQAGVQWTVGGVLLMSAACFLLPAYLAYLRTRSGIFALMIGALFAALPFAFVLHKRQRRFAKFEQLLPEALDLVVSALRAGHSMISGLGLIAEESPAPLGNEFRICYEENNYGLELRTSLENLTARVPLQDLKLVVTAILIQKESGGNLAEVLEKTAHVIRERFRLKRQVRVYTAQGRLTGWILALLPPVLGIALFFMDPKMMSLLWTRPIGVKMLYISAAMMAAGAFVIQRIVRVEV